MFYDACMRYLHLIGLLAFSIVLAGCSPQLRGSFQPSPSPETQEQSLPSLNSIDGVSLANIVLGSEITVPETQGVQLKLTASTQEFKKGDERGSVTLGDLFVATQAGESIDVLGYVNVNHGGSGTQQYLILERIGQGGKHHTSSLFIGDRVPVKSLTLQKSNSGGAYEVVISYLERQPDEPMVNAPTVPKTLVVTVKDHLIVNGKQYK
jgi:hypothetical protein